MLDLHKKVLVSFFNKYLPEKEKEYKKINGWSEYICTKLLQFIINGKMIRGGLVLRSYLFIKDNISEDAIKVAAAIELIHSSLLIHDDIMDKDKFRRGEKTIPAQFSEIGEKQNYLNPEHFGNSIGISFGDLGFFMGFELLSQIKEVSENKVNEFISGELSKVTLAQMQDVDGGYSKDEFSENEILSIYKYKTGRYSISTPLIVGAMLAGMPNHNLRTLENLGEDLGILFQIKDDELNLFGKKNKTGKPNGSDIRENKKTLLRHFLYKSSSKEQQKKLRFIFGNSNISKVQIKYVLDLIKELKIRERIKEITNKLEKKTKNYIDELKLPDKQKHAFLEFLEYNLERKK
jgi:geranylgeranyl diphosphate synthase, type I